MDFRIFQLRGIVAPPPSGEPCMKDVDRSPCRVYHTFDLPGFLRACKTLNVMTFPNGQTTQDMTSFESLNNNKIGLLRPLQVLGVGPGSTMVYNGTIVSLNVAVKVIQRTGAFSEMYNNLWRVNACDNIVRFYRAELHESSCLLAFEECEQTLHGYVYTQAFLDSLKTTTWSTVFCNYIGIVMGLHHLHGLNLAHGNLNPHNIWLTENYVPRISVMSNSQSLDYKSQGKPGPLTQVYYHPRLWDCTKRLQFFRDVSYTLQATINDPNFKFLTQEFETIKTKAITKDHRGRRRWKACFKKKLVKHTEDNRCGSTKYDGRSVYHLLRFIRNYIYAQRGLNRGR
ncbi:hypothetical protein CTI12_AA002770 [Artemisia annua]|uniref:Protein kinase domain-containing protein n=1 Tax=Artemisia annua TaxID=35608 RepID=A0A2U1QNB0_ARTAN|nr:hypothetical protein CTI12_AA002770 [Artemisia annua]